jgi:hypothetical protein
MNTQTHEFVRFLKLLSDNDCLKHVVLVGSWAEHLYYECGVLKGFEPNIKTMDIDFLIKNMRRPAKPISLTSLAKEAGYLVNVDRINGTTKIYERSGLEIEFLIGKAGAGKEAALKTNIGVTAQSLWHMNILTSWTLEVEYLGMTITVPAPEAYAIHKMVINSERKEKQVKDVQAVKGIWPFLDNDKSKHVVAHLTKKELKAFEEFKTAHNLY